MPVYKETGKVTWQHCKFDQVFFCTWSLEIFSMPVHLAQMHPLESDDPATWKALKSGEFVIAKSEVSFTHLFTDQALEQETEGLKRHGGKVGLSQNEAALDRTVTITPHLA